MAMYYQHTISKSQTPVIEQYRNYGKKRKQLDSYLHNILTRQQFARLIVCVMTRINHVITAQKEK